MQLGIYAPAFGDANYEFLPSTWFKMQNLNYQKISREGIKYTLIYCSWSTNWFKKNTLESTLAIYIYIYKIEQTQSQEFILRK